MIYDTLLNIKPYLGISENLDAAIRFIAEHDLNELSLGRIYILGKQIYADVIMEKPEMLKEENFRIHKLYMDIHIDILGTEKIEIGNTQNMNILKYNAQEDEGIVECTSLSQSLLGADHFIICMAGEPHKISESVKNTTLKKCILKVHI